VHNVLHKVSLHTMILHVFVFNFKMQSTNKTTIYMSTYLIFQASEKSAQAKKWAEPHIETAKTVMPSFHVL